MLRSCWHYNSSSVCKILAVYTMNVRNSLSGFGQKQPKTLMDLAVFEDGLLPLSCSSKKDLMPTAGIIAGKCDQAWSLSYFHSQILLICK